MATSSTPGRSGVQWRLRLLKPSTVDASITACNLDQVDAQCLLMEDDTDIFPHGWVPLKHPTLCGCASICSPPSAQCPTSSIATDAPLHSSPMVTSPSAPALPSVPSEALSSSKKPRSSRTETSRRGVIRTMQNCFKKVKRFVKLDNAGSLPRIVCALIVVSLDVKTILYYRRGQDTRTVHVFNAVEGVDRESSDLSFTLAQIIPVGCLGILFVLCCTDCNLRRHNRSG
jgi:hypothetical protein